MQASIKNRLKRLESRLKPPTDGYQLSATIIVDDSTTDAEIETLQKARPDRRYIRWGDFCDECI